MNGTVVIGVGNPARGDDAAGLEVVRRVRASSQAAAAFRESNGDAAALMDMWTGYARAIVADAAHGGGAAGHVHRFQAERGPLPAALLATSTHDFGVACAVELARALGRLPPEVVVYAIEGEDYSHGRELSAAVEAAVAALVPRIREELTSRELAATEGRHA